MLIAMYNAQNCTKWVYKCKKKRHIVAYKEIKSMICN